MKRVIATILVLAAVWVNSFANSEVSPGVDDPTCPFVVCEPAE